MNSAKKILLAGIAAIITCCFGQISMASTDIGSIIEKSPINKNAIISVSVKNPRNGKVFYEYNQEKLLNPASSLKLFTMKAVYDELGPEFTFDTKLYKDSENNLYIKLSGDPSFSTGMLKELLSRAQGPVKDVIIDASATDGLEWGIGWMWDNETNPYLPKYSPTTINENKIMVTVNPGTAGFGPEIQNNSIYKTGFVNLIKNGTVNDIKVSRQPWKSGDITVFEGTVYTPRNIVLPIANTERFFVDCVKNTLAGLHIKQTGGYKFAPVPEYATEIGKVSSAPLKKLIANALKNSNSLYAELIFKAGGAKLTSGQGKTADGVKLFEKYYSELKATAPSIVDASGVSRNDIVCTDWMTEALNKMFADKNFRDYEILMAKPIEGTLSNRLLDISKNLRAKTGSISNVSSITGFVEAKSGLVYSFAIIIQNYPCDTKEAKMLEDRIIRAIYDN